MSAIAGLPANLSSQGGSGLRGQTLGQADFLRLMTAQMTMQDPFNPMDGRDMVAQMAQFSQVAGVAEMNKSLAALAAELTGGVGGASRGIDPAWIGRDMLVEGDRAAPRPDGSYAGEIDLPTAAEAVTLRFLDGSGAVVHQRAFGAQGAGALAWEWDGRDASGAAVPGPLRMTVDTGGVAATNASWTAIRGIQSPAGGASARLVTPLGLLSPDQALRLA